MLFVLHALLVCFMWLLTWMLTSACYMWLLIVLCLSRAAGLWYACVHIVHQGLPFKLQLHAYGACSAVHTSLLGIVADLGVAVWGRGCMCLNAWAVHKHARLCSRSRSPACVAVVGASGLCCTARALCVSFCQAQGQRCVQ